MYRIGSSRCRLLLTTAAATTLLASSALCSAAVAATNARHTTHAKTKKPVRKANSAIPATTTPAATSPAPNTTATTTINNRSNANSAVIANAAASGFAGNSSEQITVTGSRITQNKISDMFPTTTVDAEQMRKRGYNNLGMALMAENPAFATATNSPVGTQGSYGAGQFLPNMFNLGAQRTLSLVDGMRFVSDASSSMFGAVGGSPVDASVLPMSMVKKVDTMAIGGAPIYGSDAIAGTINYQLIDDFQGVRVNGQGGFTQRRDDGNYQLSLLTGTHFDHDRGSVVFDAEWNRQYALPVSSRSYWAGQNQQVYLQNPNANGKYQYVLGRNSRSTIYTTSGIPAVADGLPTYLGQNDVGVTNAAGQNLIFSHNGKSLIPFNPGTPSSDGIDAFGGNGYAQNAYGNIMSPWQRLNLTSIMKYDFTPHLHGKIEGFYQQGESVGASTSGYYNTALFGSAMVGPADPTTGNANGNLALSTSNPYLTSAERTTIVNALKANGSPTDTFYLARNSADYALDRFITDNRLFRFVGDLDGDFNLGHRNFVWKAIGTYGQSYSRTFQPEIVTQNYENALDATTNASGQIVCAPHTSSPLATVSSNCSPLNPFGVGQASRAATDYITASTSQTQLNAQFDIIANVQSKIATLPAGDIRYVLGYEHRREGFDFNPGAFEQGQDIGNGQYAPYGALIPVMPTSGAYHTHEAFGELDVPLVSPKMHMAGVYNLAAHGAARYVYNSATGGFVTYSAGGAYSPTRDITFKGNYTHALRAPSVMELYAPRGSSYDYGNDPCSTQFIDSGPNPATRAANCAKAGIPRGGFQSNINNYTVLGTASGNSHLRNETANSFEGGVLLTPRWVPGLSIQSMFTDVLLKHEIVSLGVQDLMDACYDSASYPNVNLSGQNVCNAFTRDSASHQITNFNDGYYNIAQSHMQALQSSLTYDLPLRRVGLPDTAGELVTTVNYVHYVNYTQTYLAASYTEYGSTAVPQDNFTANFNYYRGPFNFQWQMQYYGKSKYALNVLNNVYQNDTFKQYFMFNMSAGYQFAQHYNVNFSMNNVFDAKPQYPYVGSLQRYYDAVIGRSFNISVQAEF